MPTDSPAEPEEHVTADTKAKFREALARKQSGDGAHGPQVQADGRVAGPKDSDSASSQQMFRRKSGM
jgi:uncharacterized protein DUF5302